MDRREREGEQERFWGGGELKKTIRRLPVAEVAMMEDPSKWPDFFT